MPRCYVETSILLNSILHISTLPGQRYLKTRNIYFKINTKISPLLDRNFQELFQTGQQIRILHPRF